MNCLLKFLFFSEKYEQKIDFIRFLTKIYLILSFTLNLKRIIYFDKRDYFKLPGAKKVLSEKKNVTGCLKLCNPLKALQLFSSPWNEQ